MVFLRGSGSRSAEYWFLFVLQAMTFSVPEGGTCVGETRTPEVLVRARRALSLQPPVNGSEEDHPVEANNILWH